LRHPDRQGAALANDRSIMGKYRNRQLANLLGWFTTAVMALAAIALVATGGG
jgi:Mn2+/Fe2+ NRAMP family transporter